MYISVKPSCPTKSVRIRTNLYIPVQRLWTANFNNPFAALEFRPVYHIWRVDNLPSAPPLPRGSILILKALQRAQCRLKPFSVFWFHPERVQVDGDQLGALWKLLNEIKHIPGEDSEIKANTAQLRPVTQFLEQCREGEVAQSIWSLQRHLPTMSKWLQASS